MLHSFWCNIVLARALVLFLFFVLFLLGWVRVFLSHLHLLLCASNSCYSSFSSSLKYCFHISIISSCSSIKFPLSLHYKVLKSFFMSFTSLYKFLIYFLIHISSVAFIILFEMLFFFWSKLLSSLFSQSQLYIGYLPNQVFLVSFAFVFLKIFSILFHLFSTFSSSASITPQLVLSCLSISHCFVILTYYTLVLVSFPIFS